MFGRLGWAEILIIVVLLVILFGHAKVPGMMKSLADGINIFKKEIKDTAPAKAEAPVKTTAKPAAKKPAAKKVAVKKTAAKKSVKK